MFISFCLFLCRTQGTLTPAQKTQAILTLRLLLLDEFSKRGIPPHVTRQIVEARLQLLEEYEKQGVPFHIAKERVIHEEERWNLLVDFERQSLSFEEAEQRIDRRFQLLNMYEKQGMQRADAAQKILREEVVRDFKAEFVRLGYMHTEAQELAERRLFLLDKYQRKGFSPEEASKKLIAEELEGRDSDTLMRQRQTTVDYNHCTGALNYRPNIWPDHSSHISLQSLTACGSGEAASTCAPEGYSADFQERKSMESFSPTLVSRLVKRLADYRRLKEEVEVVTPTKTLEKDPEEAITNRIGKLLQKLVSQNVTVTQADREIENYKITEKVSNSFQPKDLRNMSEAEREQLQEEFERSCREEIQNLFALLLEHQVPSDEAKARLQTLKVAHENRRQALFSADFIRDRNREKSERKHGFQKETCTGHKDTLLSVSEPSIEYDKSHSADFTLDGHSIFQKQDQRQNSQEQREFLRSSSSDVISNKHLRTLSTCSRSTSGSPKRKRTHLDSRSQSKESNASQKSFKKLYSKTKSLGALDFFEQILKGPTVGTSRVKSPLPSLGRSQKRTDFLSSPSRPVSSFTHNRSFSPYSRNRSRSPRSRTRSSSRFSWRGSRQRSRSIQRSNSREHSRTRSPAFKSQHSDKGHNLSAVGHSRLSFSSSCRSRSRSPRSRWSRQREYSSNERIKHSFRRNRDASCSSERPFLQGSRHRFRTRSPSLRSRQSFANRYSEKSDGRRGTPSPRLRTVSPPTPTDHSPYRRVSDELQYRRHSSGMRDQFSSHSEQFRTQSRDVSRWRQHPMRGDFYGDRLSVERHEGEQTESRRSRRPVFHDERINPLDNSAEFHFQSGVWYDSDLESLSSLRSSPEKVLLPEQGPKSNQSIHSINHPDKAKRPLKERKRMPSMESISSCDDDEVFGVKQSSSTMNEAVKSEASPTDDTRNCIHRKDRVSPASDAHNYKTLLKEK